jgi:hypothetical protein
MSTREYNLKDYSRIQVKFPVDVEIVRAEAYSVHAEGNDTQLDNLKITQEGDRLIMSYKVNLKSVLAAPFSRMHARISMPDLREFNLAGAAHGMVRGFTSSTDFGLFVSGASQLDISDMEVGNMTWDLSGASRIHGDIKASTFDLKVSGASRIDLRGSAQDIELDVAGASHIELDDFPVKNAKVRLVGASHAAMNLAGKLDVRLEGASRLEYEGQPTMGDVQVTGASTLKQR